MFQRKISRFCVLVAGLTLAAGLLQAGAQQKDARGRKFKVPPPSSRIEVTVVRDASGKPVEAAAVIFHPMEGESDRGAMELKTNEEGKAMIDVIPIGDTVRLQVIAKGFQTYGQDYKIDKDEIALEVRLKRPGEQYSIYKNHDTTGGSSGDKPADGAKTGSSGDGKSSTPPATPPQN